MELNMYSIKNKLERLTFSVHLKHPKVEISGSQFKFNCCCESFGTICLAESKEALAEEGKRAIIESFNKAFKKLR